MSKEMADRLRSAICASGLSANELANKNGVPQTTISRFLRGKDMGIHRASKLAAYLGLELKAKR
jgi:ribosome-binding protein aMBF1 (putative translation factor)